MFGILVTRLTADPPEARMTSCVDRLIRRTAFAALAVFALAALTVAAEARAQAPPAAVDQYKPAPPGSPIDPDQPGGGPGGGDPTSPGAGAPGAGGVAAPGGDAPPAGAGTPARGAEGGGNGDSGKGSGAEAGTGAGKATKADDPVVGGYPLTSGLVAGIIVIVIGLCAALALAAWRRYRESAALAESS